MQTINNQNISPFDVDDTLVLPLSKKEYFKGIKAVKVPDPLTPGKFIRMQAHEPMIRLLKEEKHKGSFVIVWSRGGSAWAGSVVEALNLEAYVDLIMSKPLVYFDDLSIEKWLIYRVYLDPKMKYKK